MHYENYPPGQRPRVDVGMKAQSTFRKIQRKIKEHCGIKAIRTRKKKAHPGEAVGRTHPLSHGPTVVAMMCVAFSYG